jgi:hypothetical protein
MNSKQREEWNNRETVVTVQVHCNECNSLKSDVEKRTWNNGSWSHRKTFTLESCKSCYDDAVRKAVQEDNPSYDGFYLRIY